MSLFLQKVEIVDGWSEFIGHSLILEFKTYHHHNDSAHQKMSEFLHFFMDMCEAQWTSDKLMALAQLMFEVEQATKGTITVSGAFQKYGKKVVTGDLVTVIDYPPMGIPSSSNVVPEKLPPIKTKVYKVV